MDSGLKLWGIMSSSAIVLSSECPTLVKFAARLARVVFGNRIQVCDGVADEGEINTAIDSLPDRGGKVHLTDGNFFITSPIHLYRDIVAWFNLWLDGSGIDTTRIFLSDNSDCNMIDNVVLANDSGWKRVSNMKLEGNGDDQASGHGIYCAETGIGNQYDMTFHNIYVSQTKEDGFNITDGWGIRINDCLAETCLGRGYYLSGNQCYFRSNFSAYNGGNGFELAGSEIRVSDCFSYSDAMHGFYVTATSIQLDTCEVYNWGSDTVSTYEAIHADSAGCTVSSCIVIGSNNTSTHMGIRITNRSIVTGCTVRDIDPAGECIYLKGDDLICNGNYIEDGAIGIKVDNCDDAVISNNRITSTTPIDTNLGTCVRPMIIGNNWEGSTNDMNIGIAVNPRITSNLDLNGAWFAGDNPG